jgi:hypothetical protein
MALIPSNPEKIYEESVGKIRPLSESTAQQIGGSVNYLLDQVPLLDGIVYTKITFLSDAIWTVPSNVSRVIIEGCGGGSGGGSGFLVRSDILTLPAPGVGGVGAAKGYGSLSVSPNTDVFVKIGKGGAPGIGNDKPGAAGESSFFGGLVFNGASPPFSPTRVSPPQPLEMPLRPQGETLGHYDYRDFNTEGFGGVLSVNRGGYFNIYGFLTPETTTFFQGGSGGAGPYGSGTLGCLPPAQAQSAGANTGAGGGGGFSEAGIPFNVGSAGASGRIIVSFYSKP